MLKPVVYITIFSFALFRSCQDIKTVIATTKIELEKPEGFVSAR
jgi:hypothetical protein